MIIIANRFIPFEDIRMKYVKQGFFEIFKMIEIYDLEKLLKCADGQMFLDIFIDNLFNGNKEYIEYVITNINEDTFTQLKELVREMDKLKKKNDAEESSVDKKTKKQKTKKSNESLTYKRLYAMLGVHCGLSEKDLDECTYSYFNDCVNELMIKLNYESHLPSLGNSNYDINEIQKNINAIHPFNIDSTQDNKPKRLTLKDVQASGLGVTKLEGVKLIKDMVDENKINT